MLITDNITFHLTFSYTSKKTFPFYLIHVLYYCGYTSIVLEMEWRMEMYEVPAHGLQELGHCLHQGKPTPLALAPLKCDSHLKRDLSRHHWLEAVVGRVTCRTCWNKHLLSPSSSNANISSWSLSNRDSHPQNHRQTWFTTVQKNAITNIDNEKSLICLFVRFGPQM